MRRDWIGLCFYPEIKFRIIQHFIANPELRQNQSQIARSLHTPQVSVSRHISDLVSLRLLHEERYGRAAVYCLNSKSALVNRLLSKVIRLNRDFLSDWVHDRMKSLSEVHKRQVKKVVLFGSAARLELRASSDVDLLAIVSPKSTELEAELQSILVAGGSEEGFKINLQVESAPAYEHAAGKGYLGVAKKEGVPLWPSP